MRGFAGVVVFMSLGLTFVSSQASPAHAVDFECYVTPQFSGRDPEAPGTGPEALFAAGPTDYDSLKDETDKYGIRWNDPDTYTTFEKDGVRGAQRSTTYWYHEHAMPSLIDGVGSSVGSTSGQPALPVTTGAEKRCEFIDSMESMMAQTVFDLDRTITTATIALRQKATDQTPFLNMIRSMSPSINNLRDHLFIPGMVTIIMLAGIWVIMKSGKQREVIQGLVWMGGSLIIVGFLLSSSHAGGHEGDANYLWVAEETNATTNSLVNGFGSLLLPTVASNGPCHLGANVDPAHRGVRLLDCSMYENLVFDPWAKGQFGGIGDHPVPFVPGALGQATPPKNDKIFVKGADMRLLQLDAQSVSYPEAYPNPDPGRASPEYPWSVGGDSSTEFDTSTKHGQWNVIRWDMFETPQYHDNFKAWKGENGSARMSAAFTGLISATLVGIFVSATSILTMIWNAVPVILWLALPIVGLISSFPPLQKFLKGWAETLIKASTLGVVFGIAQMMAMMVVSGVLQSNASIGWKCLLMVVLVLALWKVVQAARDGAFTPSFGGHQLFDGDSLGRDMVRHARTAKGHVSKVGRTTGRVAHSAPARALVGGATGATVGGAVGLGSGIARTRHRAEESRRAQTDSAKKKLTETLGREPTPEEIAKEVRGVGARSAGAALAGVARSAGGGVLTGGQKGAVRAVGRGPRRSAIASGTRAGVDAGRRPIPVRAADQDTAPQASPLDGLTQPERPEPRPLKTAPAGAQSPRPRRGRPKD